MIKIFSVFILLSLLTFSVMAQALPTKIHVNGVDLHYIESGKGEPLILVHGGQGDYRSWGPQEAVLAKAFHVIAYSRRFSYPNQNPDDPKYDSAFTEAEDLVALVRALKLKRVHLVGGSIGAFTALVFAVKHPEMVRSLVLAEPPVHSWARDDIHGRQLYLDFMRTVWTPAASAFRSGHGSDAMRILVDAFAGAGKFDTLPPQGREAAMQSAQFFRNSTFSTDPFPNLSKKKVSRLKMPILIITGANTLDLHKFVNDELARLLPHAKRVTIANAGHVSARDNPTAFNTALIEFFGLSNL